MKLYDPAHHGPIIGDPDPPPRPYVPPPLLPRARKRENPVGPMFEWFANRDGWLTRLARWVRAVFRAEGEAVEPGDQEDVVVTQPAVATSLADSAILMDHDAVETAKASADLAEKWDVARASLTYVNIRDLLCDPKTSITTAMTLFSRLNPGGMAAVADDPDVPEVIREAARKFVGRPEYRPEWAIEPEGPKLTEEEERSYRKAAAAAAMMKKGTES